MGADRLTPTIRTVRLARGLTQAQLGQAVGLTQGEVSYLERGEHWPSGIRKALAIARALDTTVEALWGSPRIGSPPANTSANTSPRGSARRRS